MIHSHNIKSIVSSPIETSPKFTAIPASVVPAEVFTVQIAKDTELSFHSSDVPVLIFILEGQGEFLLKDEKQKIEEGTLIECPAYIEHSLIPSPGHFLKLMVTKIPV